MGGQLQPSRRGHYSDGGMGSVSRPTRACKAYSSASFIATSKGCTRRDRPSRLVDAKRHMWRAVAPSTLNQQGLGRRRRRSRRRCGGALGGSAPDKDHPSWLD